MDLLSAPQRGKMLDAMDERTSKASLRYGGGADNDSSVSSTYCDELSGLAFMEDTWPRKLRRAVRKHESGQGATGIAGEENGH